MPHIENFPPIFAVVRTQALRGPCIQLLQSEARNGYSFIQNLRRPEEFFETELQRITNYQLDSTIYTLRYKTEEFNREAAEVKFWVLPFYYRVRHQRIPVLEFQYRSWIPDNYFPMPIRENTNELLPICERIEMERLYEIRREEDAMHGYPSRGDFSWPERNQDRYFGSRPGRSRYRTPSPRRDSFYSRPRTPSPIPPPEPEIRVVHVQVPVERIVTQVKCLPIPKQIGLILLDNARKGSDSCPIAATTFAECSKLAVSSCFHIFEKESLDRWMQTSTACPVCRSKIENIVSEEV